MIPIVDGVRDQLTSLTIVWQIDINMPCITTVLDIIFYLSFDFIPQCALYIIFHIIFDFILDLFA